MSTIREVLTDLEVKVAVMTLEVSNLKVAVDGFDKKVDLCKQESRITALEEKVEPLRDASLIRKGSIAVLLSIASLSGGLLVALFQWLVTKL